jgi:hypothetical protein
MAVGQTREATPDQAAVVLERATARVRQHNISASRELTEQAFRQNSS